MRTFKPSTAVLLGLALFLPATAMAEEPNEPLTQALANLTSVLGTYLAALAGTSGLVVALLEAYKKLFSVRGKFHRTAVIRWLSQDPQEIPRAMTLAKPGLFSALALGGGGHYAVQSERMVKTAQVEHNRVTPYNPAKAYAEFFHLTSGQAQPKTPNPSDAVLRWRGVDRAVFELETARMMTQIQDAADAVLNSPFLYPHLYAFLTRGAPDDAAIWRDHLDQAGAGKPITAPTKADADCYARVRLLVRRQLDAFQTVTTCRWGDLNQWWAMVLGAVILFVALVMAAGTAALPPSKDAFDPLKAWLAGWEPLHTEALPLAGVVLKAILGGVLAPLAKDLLAGISALKFTK